MARGLIIKALLAGGAILFMSGSVNAALFMAGDPQAGTMLSLGAILVTVASFGLKKVRGK